MYFLLLSAVSTISQSNSLWIDLYTSFNNLIVKEYYLSYNKFYKLHFPDKQDPQIIILIGDKLKTKAIGKLELLLNSNSNYKKIYLQLVPSNTKARSPILIADCELYNTPFLNRVSESFTAGIKQYTLLWYRKVPTDRLDTNTLAYLVYSKLISSFSTVIYFFADDLGETQALADILASWLVSLNNRSSDLPVSIYPRVLILKAKGYSRFKEEKATIDFMQELAKAARARNGSLVQRSNRRLSDERFNILLTQQFGSLQVLALPSTKYQSQLQNPDNLWELLKTRILEGLQYIQDRCCRVHVAFSANYFKTFFYLACKYFGKDIVTLFSFVKALRLANPVLQDLSFYITNFLKGIKLPQIELFAILFIASAITLDSYPPEIYSK